MQAKATAALVEQFETAHEAVCARDRDLAHERALEATSLSLSLALGISLRAADKKLALALGLDAHPDLADALSAGRIDEAQAGVIYDHAAGLPRPRRPAGPVDRHRPGHRTRPARMSWSRSSATAAPLCGRSRRTSCARS